MIPYGRQDVTEADIDAVVEVLRSDFITQGPAVPRFEDAVAAKVGAEHSVAVNSGTSALHVACLALGLGPGDRLWTSPNTFVASANCGRYCRADVDFVDIDPLTWNMDLSELERKLMQAKKDGQLPKVLVPVHFAGQPTDQKEIWELAEEYGFWVIEDASHAIGASRNGEPVGSCRWSDITVFSFHPVKIITTAEGGMALTNDEELAEQMSLFRTHGITREAARLQQMAPGPWYYEQQQLGFNYRMTDIQAALGLSQLPRLEEYVSRRNVLADRYNAAFKDLPLQLPIVLPENRSAYHLYVIRLKLNEIQKTHREVFEELRQKGIGVNLHYMPVHLQPYYRELGFVAGQFPEAERHGDEAMTLPLYPKMMDDEQERVIVAVREITER
ncbi:UDP-4-amino-4,6-dideoxy-N-acetyl-beta-L-altrosamine transaminase [Methanocalculus taiwanensis]|uniref:UDP-4-amino-4, 6-dideoxy-N-acetyl-beta-L-altrosamine transaminase n=1 Tax=Methanocalculus taiwanensis TaxID=106207 RepID=A0ABD4TK82_9EURY|nr:UDP-4-amino-4,6-dideoxy-N-acetyl-beta-L-altrosamine transaminase [Methanocalculus taiwanensis]MCQ1538188.1 UDP-4-amino-4,6-dideoxy-N-acetyl-beta-L-altrosamine transaminase [Methanocalculus taiwanensis]